MVNGIQHDDESISDDDNMSLIDKKEYSEFTRYSDFRGKGCKKELIEAISLSSNSPI